MLSIAAVVVGLAGRVLRGQFRPGQTTQEAIGRITSELHQNLNTPETSTKVQLQKWLKDSLLGGRVDHIINHLEKARSDAFRAAEFSGNRPTS